MFTLERQRGGTATAIIDRLVFGYAVPVWRALPTVLADAANLGLTGLAEACSIASYKQRV